MATELVNNSFLHVPTSPQRDWVKMRLGFAPEFVRLEVIDPGVDVPEKRFIPRQVGEAETSGRGLAIVDALSTCWGTDRIAHGHRLVWCDFDMPAEVAPGRGTCISARAELPQEAPDEVCD
ncbi:ATP-binding protein [Nonomuraea jiangxiensis]|uniref:ATP-binding protein n=1 Tax=Nonomuraea jiangxiensis TaxID=633440 RepID=UPI00115F86D5|nr:ATP-binding protein [Nonomuraea jiangxiensis]